MTSNLMKRSELFFDLPEDLIAQEPFEPRDHCRLMALNRKDRSIKHDRFFNIGDYLREGDVLVFNQSKVLPARLVGMNQNGKKREVLLLKDLGNSEWEVLIGGKTSLHDTILFQEKLTCTVLEKNEGAYRIKFDVSGVEFLKRLHEVGQAPTPPYVKKMLNDPELYQTVYAKELGSAAAPTAGLHFTQDLLDQLKQKGVQQEFVTLHVGLGTFQPVKTEIVEDHPIHSEWYSVDQDVYERLLLAKKEGRRIIAVGTTSVRVLETLFTDVIPVKTGISSKILTNPLNGNTSIFIYPGYQFKAIDTLITNFHTPYSSLLALVYGFASEQLIKNAYQAAINEKYRFFSFGDAMIIE